MSSERRPASARRTLRSTRRRKAFLGTFALVIGALVVVGLGGAVVTTTQGPRTTEVQVDPAGAAAASGSRLIVTTTQALEVVTPEQVTVTPAAPFTVDTSGRSVGVRFTVALYDDTEYTVRIDDLQGAGGGPTSTVTESFTTPPIDVHLLRRGQDVDTIYRVDLAGDGVPVFEHEHIEDYRATATHLVVSVREDDAQRLIVMDLDGANASELRLPGDGYASNLQSADRGDLIGYTFTSADVGAEGALEATLFMSSLETPDAEPVQVPVAGDEQRVDDWRFVPDTDSLLVLTFDSTLLLSSASGADPVALGSAIAIDGIARGRAVATIERFEGMRLLDLSDGTDSELLTPTLDAAATLAAAVPLPGATGTLQTLTRVDGFTPLGTTLDEVAADAAASTVFETAASDAVLQSCLSPSGRYAAVLVAPDIVSNPYDGYDLPLPETLETHVVDLDQASEVVALTGSAISWCQVPPT